MTKCTPTSRGSSCQTKSKTGQKPRDPTTKKELRFSNTKRSSPVLSPSEKPKRSAEKCTCLTGWHDHYSEYGYKTARDYLAACAPGALCAEGFDDALIGISDLWVSLEDGGASIRSVLVYDYVMCVGILMKRDKMSYMDATEFMDFNVIGSWVGPDQPIFVRRVWK